MLNPMFFSASQCIQNPDLTLSYGYVKVVVVVVSLRIFFVPNLYRPIFRAGNEYIFMVIVPFKCSHWEEMSVIYLERKYNRKKSNEST